MTSGDLAVKPFDPLLHDIDLPLVANCYPIGFPARFRTNSRDVVEAASESWGMYTAPEFATPPLDLRLVVQPEGELASTPAFRSQAFHFAIVAGPDNFATFDTRSLSGFGFFSQKTAADHGVFRYHFLEAAVYFLLAQRYVVPMHAACVARDGKGTLLCGASGSGKSTLSFACARAGWTYVADDCTWLLPGRDDREAIGKSHLARFRDDAPGLFPELENYATGVRKGKLSIEVPIADFPRIPTSRRCRVERLVLLDRRAGSTPAARKRPSREVVESLLNDMPSYEPEVNAMYARTLGRLAEVPAYHLRYESLDDALRLLSEML